MVILDLRKEVLQIISQNKNADPEFETDCLIQFVTGKKRFDFPNQENIPTADVNDIIEYAQKRKNGYPLQYILGNWQFFDLELEVGEGVLIPRQDTEIVCQEAFKIINDIPNAAVIDLCSGTGAIALAIKKYCPHCSVAAIEKSPQAYEYLVKNIKKTSLQIMPVLADVLLFDENIEDEAFDVIVANPPYIDQDIKDDMQKELSFEPQMALFAPQKGLFFYKQIAKFYRPKIKEKGYLIFEYGFDQNAAIKDIVSDAGYAIVKEIVDLSGNARGIICKK